MQKARALLTIQKTINLPLRQTAKKKTYSASLANDTATAALQSAVYTKTINGVEVTFTYNGNYELQSVTGTGVIFADGKFIIGNKTYSASLSNDTVTETLESAVYAKTVEGIEVTFTYNGKYELTNATGDGGEYLRDKKILLNGKTYTITLNEDKISFEFNSHEFNNNKDEVKISATNVKDTISNSGSNITINAKSGNDTITDYTAKKRYDKIYKRNYKYKLQRQRFNLYDCERQLDCKRRGRQKNYSYRFERQHYHANLFKYKCQCKDT